MTTRSTVVITGAARGIGRALALAWAAQGARLVLAARSTVDSPSKLPGTLEETAELVEAAGGEVHIVRADLSTDEGIRALVDAIDSVGGCDVLVNNAAVSFLGDFLDVPARRWSVAINVNLLAPVALTLAVLPAMVAKGSGTVVNVSSGAALSDVPAQLPYGCSKIALERLSTGLHHQYSASGVSIQCVRIDELVPTEAVTYSLGDTKLDVPICPVDVFADAVVRLVDRPELSGEILTHARLRELELL